MPPRRPIRVAYTLEQCWHEVPGGTAVAAVEVARALARRPTEVEVRAVAAHHRRPPAGGDLPVPVAAVPAPRLGLYEAWHRLRWPPVQVATGDVDVIHATGMAMPPRTAPLVATVHDLLWRDPASGHSRRGRSFLDRALALIVRDADLVLCSSRPTMAALKQAGLEPERLRYVPLGVAPEPVDAADVERVRAEHHLEGPYVLWVGTVEPRKNVPLLIEAHRRLPAPRPTLVLAGPGGWGGVELAVGPEVIRIGALDRRDLHALYAGCVAFCYPSRQEGFGLPVLEAMSHGRAVITTAGTPMADVAGEAAELVEPNDLGSLAAALVRIVTDDAHRAELEARGRDVAAAHTWEATAEATLAAYRELVP